MIEKSAFRFSDSEMQINYLMWTYWINGVDANSRAAFHFTFFSGIIIV